LVTSIRHYIDLVESAGRESVLDLGRESDKMVAMEALLLEMALSKKVAENRITGLSWPLNKHVLKLLAFQMDDGLRAHFRKEIRTWLRDIQVIRLKPHTKPGTARWYFDLLYDGPFGGVEEQNAAVMCDGIAEDYEGKLARNATPVAEVVMRLRAFHEALSAAAASGEPLVGLSDRL
jgi:hypothetical protein